MDYKPRAYFGGKLEPKDTVLHDAGQDIIGFIDYCKTLAPEQIDYYIKERCRMDGLCFSSV